MRGLNGKRVLITGGAGGIGTATAERFLEEGSRVVVLDRDAVGLRRVERELPSLSVEITFLGPLTRNEFEMICADYGEDQFKKTGIEYDPEMSLYRPVGCEACSGTGYRGRMGIHELMEGTAALKLLIKNQASTEEIYRQAVNDGMTTLKQDGILKVLQGLTDMTEVRRVCIN